MSLTAQEALEVMAVFDGFDGPDRDWLGWRTDDEYAPITMFVNCNDLFCWATADCEDITPADLPALKRAVEDIDSTQKGKGLGAIYGCSLWVARKRGERPQGACYPTDHPEIWPLYDACGPERQVGLGNPYRPGGRAKR